MPQDVPDDGPDDVVVVNDEGQFALWPGHRAVPAGWTVAHGPAGRAACVRYVEATWTDMRPHSLVAHERGR